MFEKYRTKTEQRDHFQIKHINMTRKMRKDEQTTENQCNVVVLLMGFDAWRIWYSYLHLMEGAINI